MVVEKVVGKSPVMSTVKYAALGKLAPLNAYTVMAQDISKEAKVDLKTHIWYNSNRNKVLRGEKYVKRNNME